MRRLKDYLRIIAWQTGLGYLLLWAITFWTLDDGARVFGGSGVCLPDQAKVLFYWVCEARSPLSILASLVNVALTVTVWAPVYVAAATVDPNAMAIAVPILAVHLVGLPLGLFVLVRMLATALDLRRRVPGRGRPAHDTVPPVAAVPAVSADSATLVPDPTVVGPSAFFPVATTATPAPPAFMPAAPARPRPARPVKAVPPRHEFGLRDAGRKAPAR